MPNTVQVTHQVNLHHSFDQIQRYADRIQRYLAHPVSSSHPDEHSASLALSLFCMMVKRMHSLEQYGVADLTHLYPTEFPKTYDAYCAARQLIEQAMTGCSNQKAA